MRIFTRVLTLCFLAISVSLSGCGPERYYTSADPASPVTEKASKTNSVIQHLLSQAKTMSSPQREIYQLHAAYLLAEQRKIPQAQAVVAQVDRTKLTPETKYLSELVSIDIQRIQGQVTQAAQRLQSLGPPPHLSTISQVILHELRANLYAQQGDKINSARERVALDALLTDSAQQKENRQKIWQSLTSLPVHTLMTAEDNSGSVFDGWVALAVIMTTHLAPDAQQRALQEWQTEYPNHPGRSILYPSSGSSSTKKTKREKRSIGEMSNKNIALLLPISGSLEQTATSVQDGIFTAHNADMSSERADNITVYDTKNDTAVVEVYQEAVANGATMVIGPLTKNGVVQLNELSDLPVPALALNFINAQNRHPNELFEFGLAPEDEAKRAAYIAFQQGHHRALILAQDDEWGTRLRRAFRDEWERLGGEVQSDFTFTSKSNMNNVVRQALRINLTKEQTERLTSEPQRRQDIDMIFLAAYPSAARQIKPLLSFYYANDLPVYATSSVYALPPNTGLDRDLNGLTFCDMPWVLAPQTAQPKLHSTINELWPDTARSDARFYAFGVDAYHLTSQLSRLHNSPGFRIDGVTGVLSVPSNDRIQRQVVCAQIQQGKPELIY